MPKVRFTAEPKPNSLGEVKFTKGETYDMSDDSAERWIRRGVAEIVEEVKKAEPPKTPRITRKTAVKSVSGDDD